MLDKEDRRVARIDQLVDPACLNVFFDDVGGDGLFAFPGARALGCSVSILLTSDPHGKSVWSHVLSIEV
jgi:hypothetical protein